MNEKIYGLEQSSERSHFLHSLKASQNLGKQLTPFQIETLVWVINCNLYHHSSVFQWHYLNHHSLAVQDFGKSLNITKFPPTWSSKCLYSAALDMSSMRSLFLLFLWTWLKFPTHRILKWKIISSYNIAHVPQKLLTEAEREVANDEKKNFFYFFFSTAIDICQEWFFHSSRPPLRILFPFFFAPTP